MTTPGKVFKACHSLPQLRPITSFPSSFPSPPPPILQRIHQQCEYPATVEDKYVIKLPVLLSLLILLVQGPLAVIDSVMFRKESVSRYKISGVRHQPTTTAGNLGKFISVDSY